MYKNLNNVINKFLLAGFKLMPEMHFWEPEFTCKVIGLFIKKKEWKNLKQQGNLGVSTGMSYNPGQNICNKIEKFSKTGQDKKSLISAFGVFRVLLLKFNFWKENWDLSYASTKILDFLNLSLFPKILSLMSFGNSWGSSDTKFAILDITNPFTSD